MDVRVINPVITALVDVLTTMAQMNPEIGKPRTKEDNRAPGVVTGIIDLQGKPKSGSVAISFSKGVALDLTHRMLRMEVTEIDDQVKDLVGEMANMVAGSAKRIMEEEGFDFRMTLPTVIAGKDHEIIHKVTGPKIILPFTADSGEFYIEVCFQK